jgi:hypothetical protein
MRSDTVMNVHAGVADAPEKPIRGRQLLRLEVDIGLGGDA